MKNVLLAILICIFTTSAFAASPLTKATVQQYFDAAKNLEALEKQFPDLEDNLSSVAFSDRSKFLIMIKNLPEYNAIEKAATSTGLDDFEAFYDIGTRIMGGFMVIQMEKMPQGISIDSMLSGIEKSIEQMQAMQLPQAQIDELSSDLAQQKQSMLSMMKLAKSASAQDKAFAKQNINWLMENMSEEDEDEDDMDDMNE
tara:strand:+ start:128 stop:724 length:597 start_codon:yes stop_codon:yes gene_type:complete